MNPAFVAQHHQAVKSTVNDALTLGVLYVLMGCVGGLVAFTSRDSDTIEIIAAGSGLLLVGPGVLYLLAAAQLRRFHPRGGHLAMAAAAGQLLSILGGFVAAAAIPFDAAKILGGMAIINIFFVPALVVFLVKVNKATNIARQLEEPAPSFQVLPAIPVQRIEPIKKRNDG